MSTVLKQANGAQVAPRVGDERATISTWHALCAADADQRTKYPVYADLASNLFPTALAEEAQP